MTMEGYLGVQSIDGQHKLTFYNIYKEIEANSWEDTIKPQCAFSMIVSQAKCTRLIIKLVVFLGCYGIWQSELYWMCPIGITDFVWVYYQITLLITPPVVSSKGLCN